MIANAGDHDGPAPGDVAILLNLRRRACPADVNADSRVDLADLSRLLSRFGTPSGAVPTDGDVDRDGDVDQDDLMVVLSAFGSVCP